MKKGTLTFTSGRNKGAKWVGELKNNKPFGLGTLTIPGVLTFIGQCNSGGMQNGTVKYFDGQKYVGQMKNSTENGRGTLTYPNGHKYVGNWYNGYRHGLGTHTINKRKYSGLKYYSNLQYRYLY